MTTTARFGTGVPENAGASSSGLNAGPSMGSSIETSIVVGVGDGRLAKAPAEYIATFALGSCIAIVAYDWKRKTGGLVHVMLPDSQIDLQKAVLNPYVYADTGIPAMFKKLFDEGSTKSTIRSCIAGGAQMLERSSHFEIGKKNYLAVKRAFWQLGLFIDKEDVGGSESRSIRLDLKTGQVDLRTGANRTRILMNRSAP